MKLNVFKVKKYIGLTLASVIPFALFMMFVIFRWGLLYAIMAYGLGLVLGILLFSRLYRHPFLQMLEGDGLLVLTLDSTGVIRPFIVKITPPYVTDGKNEDIFDREGVQYLEKPEKIEAKEDKEFIKFPKKKLASAKFGFEQYPVLIYNAQLGSFLTKDALAKFEENAIAKHAILYLRRKSEELTAHMRDFARYVVEQTRPRKSIVDVISSWWFVLIVIAVIVLLAILFIPAIKEALAPAIVETKKTVQTVVTTR